MAWQPASTSGIRRTIRRRSEELIRHCAPLVVANGSADAGGNQARGKGAHAGYNHVVFCPCEFFYRPKRDNATNPIGARLRGSCAFHCPHPPPWSSTTSARPGTGNAAGTYRRMLLLSMMPGEAAFVPRAPSSMFPGTLLEAGGVVAMLRTAFSVKELVMAYYKVRIEVGGDWNPAESELEEIVQNNSTGEAIGTNQ